jgi:hypothetical protein
MLRRCPIGKAEPARVGLKEDAIHGNREAEAAAIEVCPALAFRLVRLIGNRYPEFGNFLSDQFKRRFKVLQHVGPEVQFPAGR